MVFTLWQKSESDRKDTCLLLVQQLPDFLNKKETGKQAKISFIRRGKAIYTTIMAKIERMSKLLRKSHTFSTFHFFTSVTHFIFHPLLVSRHRFNIDFVRKEHLAINLQISPYLT